MERAFNISLRRMILPLALLLVLSLPGTAMAESRAYQPTTVEEAVEYLAAQCTAAGMTDDYDIAVWMHDWLIYNADYDETLVEHRPDGVLLYGTGVCESYTLAYSLLLDRMGIPNKFVESPEMEHIWNLVQLDGEWVHVDCTWDDPVPGGAEKHSYFGMNDALMSRDHTWDKADLPASTAAALYYPVYKGTACVSSVEELEALLTRYAEEKQTDIEICYIGTDADFGLYERFLAWFYENNWKYGLADCPGSYTDYQLQLTFTYTDPWEKPSDVLDTPVDAPAFALSSPCGTYRLSNYSNNGMLLIFGRASCPNTQSLLAQLSENLESLNAAGVEVLVPLDSAYSPSDLTAIEEAYPGYAYTYGASALLWEYLEAVGFQSDSVAFPCVFVINSNGKITYYSTGYVYSPVQLLAQAYSAATYSPLPEPEENVYDGGIVSSGSIIGIEGGIAASLRSMAADSSRLLFLTDQYYYDYNAQILDSWESNIAIYEKLGMKFAVCFDIYDEGEIESLRAAYPHITFLAAGEDDNYFWDMLHAAGYPTDDQAFYLTSYLIDSAGDIVRYVNGDFLDPWSMALLTLSTVDFPAETPDVLTRIEAEAYLNTSFTAVDLSGSSITAIGSRAFAECDALEMICLPKTVSYIAEDAFSGSENVMIVCPYGSYAHSFAKAHSIPCIAR